MSVFSQIEKIKSFVDKSKEKKLENFSSLEIPPLSIQNLEATHHRCSPMEKTMFTDLEKKFLLRLMHAEHKKITTDLAAILTEEQIESTKKMISGLIKKIGENVAPKKDIAELLEIDNQVSFDGVVLTKNGKPVARLKN